MCVFCPNSFQDVLFNNNYFFSLLLWLSNSLEGGAHGFSFSSVRSAGLEQQDMAWISPSWAHGWPPPLLSSSTKHAATGTQWAVLQMFRCVLGCGNSGFHREGATPREENEGPILVRVSLEGTKEFYTCNGFNRVVIAVTLCSWYRVLPLLPHKIRTEISLFLLLHLQFLMNRVAFLASRWTSF